MQPLPRIEHDALRRTVHGLAGYLAVRFDEAEEEVESLALAVFGYNRVTGKVVGVLDAFEGSLGLGTEMGPLLWLLGQGEWVIADDAQRIRPLVARAFPEVERRSWLCMRTMVPWRELGEPTPDLQSLIRSFGMPIPESPLDEAMTGIQILGMSDHTGLPHLLHVLHRAGAVG